MTQFPYAWTAERSRAGFLYSSDGRFSRTERFESTPRAREARRDRRRGRRDARPQSRDRAHGAAAQLRRRGHRDRRRRPDGHRHPHRSSPCRRSCSASRCRATSSGRRRSRRQIAGGRARTASLLAGQEVTVRLLRRAVALAPAGERLHRRRRALRHRRGGREGLGDEGEERRRRRCRSRCPIDEAGVYVVELEAHDRLGRAAGRARRPLRRRRPARWPGRSRRPGVFTVAADKPRYEPGETATLVLQSPFQKAARARGRRGAGGQPLRVARVEGGAATFTLPILGTYAPRLPVHFAADARPPAGHARRSPATPPTSASRRRSRPRPGSTSSRSSNRSTSSSSTRRRRARGRRSTSTIRLHDPRRRSRCRAR